MKNAVILLSCLALIGLAFTNPVIESYKVDAAASQVTWTGYKVTGKHSGAIQVKEGALDFTDGALTGGSFVIDMTTITCTDIKDEGTNGKLVGHLKSDDFFGVAKYPTAKFEITKVVSRGTAGDYKVVGNLTIKENTQEYKFNANIVDKEGKMTATTKVTVDRSEFDIRYGSGSFFENLADNTIYDEFDLEIALVLVK